jgi:hypothetical protein
MSPGSRTSPTTARRSWWIFADSGRCSSGTPRIPRRARPTIPGMPFGEQSAGRAWQARTVTTQLTRTVMTRRCLLRPVHRPVELQAGTSPAERRRPRSRVGWQAQSKASTCRTRSWALLPIKTAARDHGSRAGLGPGCWAVALLLVSAARPGSWCSLPAQRTAGSNSSTTFPDGSATSACRPPWPSTIPDRNCAPA